MQREDSPARTLQRTMTTRKKTGKVDKTPMRAKKVRDTEEGEGKEESYHQRQQLPGLWKEMYGATVLGVLYTVCHVVPQGLCWNIGHKVQKPSVANARELHGLVGLRQLFELLPENKRPIQRY